MRALATLVLLVSLAHAQFKDSATLVFAPTTITDSKGRFVDGITADDLVLYDNNVPRAIHLDWSPNPISLVVVIQTSRQAMTVIDKLGGSGILLSQLLAADRGETAVVSFSDQVKLLQDFTPNPDLVTHSLRMLRSNGEQAHLLDALHTALMLLSQRPPDRRRVLLVIAEKRDRGSNSHLPEVIAQAERSNATIFWMTFSPFFQPFTVKPRTAEDLKPIEQRGKSGGCLTCPKPDETPVPWDPGPGGYVYAIGELIRLHKPDLARLFTSVSGGRDTGFLTKAALERTIENIAAEAHRHYLLSFAPPRSEPGEFHSLRVTIKNRPDLHARTRAGYWTVE